MGVIIRVLLAPWDLVLSFCQRSPLTIRRMHVYDLYDKVRMSPSGPMSFLFFRTASSAEFDSFLLIFHMTIHLNPSFQQTFAFWNIWLSYGTHIWVLVLYGIDFDKSHSRNSFELIPSSFLLKILRCEQNFKDFLSGNRQQGCKRRLAITPPREKRWNKGRSCLPSKDHLDNDPVLWGRRWNREKSIDHRLFIVDK